MSKIERINKMLKANPKDNFLRHALALEYVKEGNDSKAGEIFESLLNESPGYVGSYYHLAKLLQRNGRIEEAIAWYGKGMAEAKAAKDNHAYSELQSAYEDLAE